MVPFANSYDELHVHVPTDVPVEESLHVHLLSAAMIFVCQYEFRGVYEHMESL